MIIFTISAYLILQLGISWWISKRIQTDSDYFVGGRSFGVFIVSVSLFATWFGAETCIGSSSAVFSEGLSGSRADPFGYGLCLFLSGLLISKIWNRKYITLSDFYNDRFGSKVGSLATWVLALSSLIWAAAQLRAFGQVIVATTNIDLSTAIPIGLIFIVIYTLLGGLMGDMITDVIQAFVIGIGLLMLFYFVWDHIENPVQVISELGPERLSLIGSNETVWERLDRWAIPIFGSLVAQEIISRILSAKSETIARKACYTSGVIYLFFGMIPVILGLLGPSHIEVGDDPEQFLFLLSRKHLNPIFFGIFAGAILSALLATIDSILLAVASLISNNFLAPLMKVDDEKKKLKLGRIVIVCSALTAYLLAMNSTSIYDLLEIASAFGTAGILVITIIGLWSKLGDEVVALVTLIVGILATPVGEYGMKLESPFLFSILMSLICFIGLGFYRRKVI